VDILNPKWAEQVGAVYASPVRFLDDKVTALRVKTKELVTLALIRLAATDAAAAADELNKLRWRTQLTAEERSWVWGVVGKRAASRLQDGAINHFSHAQDQHLHGEHLVWKTRAALRAGSWQEALNAINAMPEPMRQDSTWVYWRARALLALGGGMNAGANSPSKGLAAAQMLMSEAQAASPPPGVGDAALARQLLESIASNKGFYEQLALEELGRPITLPEPAAPLSAAEKEAAQLNPGLKRALYAIQMGLRAEGVREWNYTTNLHTRGGMNDRELLAAAQLACDQQVWDRCINTSERTKNVVDMAQRFPTPHRQEVLQRASRIGLDPAYVYGLIRQESRFIMDAQSHVGAAGLMQVMPATAKWTAKKIGLSDFKPHQITERDTNIAIGTGYLKLVLDSFDGSMPLAAAAYNAGPSRSRNWRGQDGSPTIEAAIWAENVPFNETRDYVKKVLANTTNYAALLSGKPQSLKARLGLVGPLRQGKAADEDLP
jgi:soluble lytic murein transglycosylase